MTNGCPDCGALVERLDGPIYHCEACDRLLVDPMAGGPSGGEHA